MAIREPRTVYVSDEVWDRLIELGNRLSGPIISLERLDDMVSTALDDFLIKPEAEQIERLNAFLRHGNDPDSTEATAVPASA